MFQCLVLIFWSFQMSSVGECTLQLFIFPIVFQTVSFHHRATYELKISMPHPILHLHPIKLLHAGEQRELIDRNGNAWNIDGHVLKKNHFRTYKFPIEYNDQIVKFKTGFIARLAGSGLERVGVTVELIRLSDEEKEKSRGKGKRVSFEVLEINLRGGEGSNLRRLVFSTNEYISYVDVAFQLTKLRKSPPSQGQVYTPPQLYKSLVSDRLDIYRDLASKTAIKLQEFRAVRSNHPSFRHTYHITQAFQNNFAEREVADLGYLAVHLPEEGAEECLQSHMPIYKDSPIDRNSLINTILCQHYECIPSQLPTYIQAQGYLLQLNIRALFQRLIQLTISLLGENQHMIAYIEKNKLKSIISQSEKIQKPRQDQSRDFQQEITTAHRNHMFSFVRGFSSITGAQLRQPYVEITNEPEIVVGRRRESIDDTLTVFIHGYKGNEYDLSKIKSHLILHMGCSHFYSIKGLSGDKANEATISTLGETAARELLSFLALTSSYRHINLIGFSLGGVIARAMLPWMQKQKAKLNLLLTIATPHIGVRQVQNCLVRAGMCYMRRIAGVESIRQLNSQRNARASRYLLQLAGGEGLEWFKSIVLVGSYEDSYVPAYSSLVRYAGDDDITREMFARLEKGMSRAIRVSVKMQYSESFLDVITRRRTHISFLEEDSFIKYLLVRLQHYFTQEIE